jgi:integrase
MARRRSLPKYVTVFVDQIGKERFRFRRAGYPGGYFSGTPGTQQFWSAYEAYMAAKPGDKPLARTGAARSIDDLVARFYRSTDWTGNAAPVTLAKRKAVIEAFRAKHGHRPADKAPYQKLDAYIAEVAKGDGQHGGPFAAETARKLLRRLFAYAVKLGWRLDNPMQFVTFRPRKTPGFHAWSEAEIEQYRAHWPLGTKQRLAMELGLWTGKRRSDAVRMGPQHIERGELIGRDRKTDKAWTLPIAPQLAEAIAAMQPGHLCFVPSDRGKPYSAASFGNQFAKWCDAAGLRKECRFHGLRKAISRRMAEAGAGNAGIKAVTLHSRDDEVALYVASADQRRLARSSIDRISRAEMSKAKRLSRMAGGEK